MSHIGNDAIIDAQRDEIDDEEHPNNCHCEECEGACTDGVCGQCFVCEGRASALTHDGDWKSIFYFGSDDANFWQADRLL
jgi:hypothetical protein